MTDPAMSPDTPAENSEPSDDDVTLAGMSESGRTAELEAEVAHLKDQLLRALAEQENVRRRAQRERDDAVKYAAQKIASDLLSSADNLRRALETVSEEQVEDEAMKNLLAGVAATERELLGAFEKHGIHKVLAEGEKFDHNLHQAIFEVENTGKPAGTIVQVLQSGYLLNDRLLRPAMVGVAKGNAVAPAPEAQSVEDAGKVEKLADKPEGYQRIDTKV
jgi:molecular chaperone GrpE